MSHISSLLILLVVYCNTFSQTAQDYKDYIKLQAEAAPAFDTYTINIAFGNNITITDAERFTGKTLSQDEYENMFYYGSDIYIDNRKSKKIFETIKNCNLKGIRKVSTVKHVSNEVSYWDITIYVKDGYLAKVWGSPNNSTMFISEFAISVNTDEKTAKNLKKAIIELAKLSGALDVIDGDTLFDK